MSTRRDLDELMERRVWAWDLVGQEGMTQKEIAKIFGVSRQSVWRWAKLVKSPYGKSLRHVGKVGPRPKVDLDELERLILLFKKNGGEKMSAPEIAEWLRTVKGVDLHPDYLRRFMKQRSIWTR